MCAVTMCQMCVSNSLNPHRHHQNSCSNTSGPQSMAVWATANTAAPRVADSPHTAIFTILFPFPHSWPLSWGKAASRPECREAARTEQGGGGGQTVRARDIKGQEAAQSSNLNRRRIKLHFATGTKTKKGFKECQNTRSKGQKHRNTLRIILLHDFC